MATASPAKATLRERAAHEFKELAILALYLYVVIGAIVLLKGGVLRSHGIESAIWGVAAVKALLLAKFMLIGRTMKLGEGNATSPLIWPTLRKSFAFLVLLFVLTTLEEAVVGWFHHETLAESVGGLYGIRLQETLAGFLITLLVLIPYFAVEVLSEELGEGRLARMFFVARESRGNATRPRSPDQFVPR